MSSHESCAVSVDVWGDFACFTRTENKVERVSYDVPTPSACRGILNAIYSKPKEFYYEITGIEVMRPIRRLDMQKLEVYQKANPKKMDDPINSDEKRTRRHTVYLRDVYYRIDANIHRRDDLDDPNVSIQGLRDQFIKRIRSGKCFYQPYLGLRECMCFFAPVDQGVTPIQESMDCGIMLYDIFNIENNTPLDTTPGQQSGSVEVAYYHPYMINGHISVPLFNSGEVMRKG